MESRRVGNDWALTHIFISVRLKYPFQLKRQNFYQGKSFSYISVIMTKKR